MATLNFGKITQKKKITSYSNSFDLFDTLDRKATHQSLRLVQISAIKELDKQSNNKDVVLKLSTGSGKTVIGLIYLEMMRRKYQDEMVLYLCPTKQLVEQVVAASQKIGVPAESGNISISSDCHEGKSILVCTYDKIFNGQNIFQRDSLIPSAIVLDDFHAGVERVKSCYTLELTGEIFEAVRSSFNTLCSKSDPGLWRGIMNNEYDARYEVPSWVWSPQSSNIATLIVDHISRNPNSKMIFGYKSLRRYFDLTRLCICGTKAEISFAIPPIEDNDSYQNAKHRLFMSASIKDGSSLIKELNCDSTALTRVIEVPEDRGAGERMILPISNISSDLQTADIASLCHELSRQVNVVVLTSSERQSAEWIKKGATLVIGDKIDTAVEILNSTTAGNFYVFMQRFDGVDLADDACRILVIDGVPYGDKLSDLIDLEKLKNSPGFNNKIINRLEQALGRAVRSSADYAVIILNGSDIASFIGRKDVKSLLEPQTLAQFNLGKDISEQLQESDNAIQGIKDAILAALSRNEDWKSTYRELMSSVIKTTRESSLSALEQIATAERQAWAQAKSRNFQNSVDILRNALNSIETHQIQKADLIFKTANYLGYFDLPTGLQAARSAFEINSFLPRPELLPSKKYTKTQAQVAKIRDQLQIFSDSNSAIAHIETIKNMLSETSTSEYFERGLLELGKILGADSSRPERETGRGPDNLWVFDTIAFCIEAKNEKRAPIFKTEAGQLLLSLEWCNEQNLGVNTIIPVFATDVTTCDRQEDISFQPHLLSTTIIASILSSFRPLITSITYDGPLFNDIADLGRKISSLELNESSLALKLQKLKKQV